jgi:pimeloyl-ACP methyl ester carboxylesterase
MALLAKHPDRFKGAVLISLPVFRNEGEFRKLMEQHSVFDRLAAGRFSELVCMFQPLFTSSLFKPENMPNEIFEDVKKHTWRSYSNSLHKVVIGTDLFNITKTVDGKRILFIHGEKDTSAPIGSARQLAESTKGARFVTLPNEGHQLFLTNSKMVWNEINAFSSELTTE